jgi:hypothetical protein
MIEGRYFDGQEMLLMHAARKLGPADSVAICFRAYEASIHCNAYYEHSRFRAVFENLLALRFFVKVAKGYAPTEEGLLVMESSVDWHNAILRKFR